MARFRLASLKSEVSYWSRTVVRATSGLQTHCQTDGDMLTVQFSDCYVRTVRFGPFHSDRYIRTVRCHQLNSLAIRSYPMNKIWEFGNGRGDACSHTANTRRLVEHSMVGHTARCSTILVCVCAKFALQTNVEITNLLPLMRYHTHVYHTDGHRSFTVARSKMATQRNCIRVAAGRMHLENILSTLNV